MITSISTSMITCDHAEAVSARTAPAPPRPPAVTPVPIMTADIDPTWTHPPPVRRPAGSRRLTW